MAWLARYRAPLTAAIIVAIAALALTTLHHLTQTVSLHAARVAFRAIPSGNIALALALTAVSYLALTFYDVLALRIIRHPLAWRTAALASFSSYALSHNLGFSALTGGSARYRVYHAAGLDAADVARIVVIAGTTFSLGILVVAGTGLLLSSGPLTIGGLSLSPIAVLVAGCSMMAAVFALPLASALGLRGIGFRQWSVPVPTPGQAIAQIGVSILDLGAASGALFVLLPGADAAMLPAFMLAYSLALLVSLVSHVPGGIGVFEATILAIVPGDRAALLASLFAYRAIYYLLPLGLAVMLFTVREGRQLRNSAALRIADAQAVATSLAPLLLSALTFVGGVLLLLSGALPPLPERLSELRNVVPLPFVEASHIAASLVGTALLILAPGLYRRLDGAWLAVRALLIAGALFSLAKGLDIEEAIVLLGIAGMLQWTRPAFYRHTALTSAPLSPSWLGGIAIAFGLSIWLGLFAYRHVDYQDSLWWEFAWSGNAPRFLRAMVAAAVVLVAACIWRLLAPAEPAPTGGAIDPEILARALASADRTDAMLALTGDKRFLNSDDRDAFLMYQVKGRSWIVMGDPVGPRDRWPELLWSIRTMADAAQGRLLLYQISDAVLPLAIELGLHIIKCGEEAQVSLAGFTLEGSAASGLRQAERRLARGGARFEVIPASQTCEILPELRSISDQWLASKGHQEKSFSLGRFDPAYLAQFDIAVVRQNDRAVAFANIWATPDKSELSLDLMRHRDDSPSGTMDFLFVHLMLWGQSRGYRRFSLGAAPLSGIDPRRLSPLWAKAASLLFNHGERFYGFRGLRAYKAKFSPHWAPRFIAGPGGLSLIHGIADIGALIAEPRA
ncbi:bifunctional lysylphosphatidylglycerol flippase/synthetase MprF [Sphingomonas sp. M1-B02]|uniref:bifunctional lysylphosphatidylglycerol flippase/synthetase MprF n=1 Tax=Sphingomonas sp. M1-B02 TaxID=3114300 RepID=UPI00223FF8C5|nr:bifunctional lysylphosphatidylglycerol flippase/synthetase MprF [Sphingomonas sp. S6-11]UZK66291.1 bifunctional lysylphosphatidylglycerol flippase/synthetase MprF [Sphingomonas sp. S6-11]